MGIGEVLLSQTFLTVLFFSLLFGFFSGLIFFHIFDSRVFDERGRLIPGPKHHLWGKYTYFSIAKLAYYSHQYSKIIFEKFLKEVGNGDIVAYNWINGKPTIIVAHPDMVKNVLSGHHLKFLKDDSWDNVKDLLGVGLGTCNEKVWQRYRNILSPLFRSSNLRDMVTTFNLHSRRLLRHWNFRLQQALQDATVSSPGSGMVSKKRLYIKASIDKEFRHLILGIMCESGFGYDFFTSKKSELFAQDFEVLLNEYSLRMSDDPLFTRIMKSNIFPINHTKQDPHIVSSALTTVRGLLEKTIHNRLNGVPDDEDSPLPSPTTPVTASSSTLDVQADDGRPPRINPSSSSLPSPRKELNQQNDLLQLLLLANEDTVDYQKLSIEEIRDHILSFMILGYENTAATLMWIIYELCLHPEIQKVCQQEVDNILTVKGIKTSAVTYEDIPKFSKLIQVLKETLRLHPPMATLSRKCTTACTIGDYSVKAGSRISISVLALHQHPDYWYLPTDFFPDRFSQENIAETIKHPFQYIPFGAGGRNCIGQRFSQMCIVVILAILLSKYHFSIDEDDKRKVQFEEKASYEPKNLRVVIQDRELMDDGSQSSSFPEEKKKSKR